VLRVARRSYDYVIIDTPQPSPSMCWWRWTSADMLVLLATLDIPSVKNLSSPWTPLICWGTLGRADR